MQTNEEMRQKWQKHYEHGDYTLIGGKTKPKRSPATIQRIILGHPPYEDKAPTSIVISIDKFYAARLKQIATVK